MALMKPALAMLSVLALSGTAMAQEIDTKRNGQFQVSIHERAFLTKEELDMLRLVQVNGEALQLFVPGKAGFAAIAAAPEDGFFRKGQMVPSAVAVADLPDQATAEGDAKRLCDQKRRGKSPCVTILTVAPR